jgi:hypothetical protein
MNMMGFRPVGYQQGGEAAAEVGRRESLIRQIIELSGITNQETLTTAQTSLQEQDTNSLQNTLNVLIARKQAEQMSRMQGSSVGELTSDQRRQLMELPSQTDFMGRPTTPEQQMQQMPYGTSEAPGLGQGVTENPGFSKETLEYFPPQRSSGGIMSLRR